MALNYCGKKFYNIGPRSQFSMLLKPHIYYWCHDNQHNDTQHNDIKHNPTQHNDTGVIVTLCFDEIMHDDTQYIHNAKFQSFLLQSSVSTGDV
jgi:hypothetical protein